MVLELGGGLFSQSQLDDNRKQLGYVSFTGASFTSANPATDTIQFGPLVQVGANGMYLYCDLYLPDGCTILSVIVYGNAGAANRQYWINRRQPSLNSDIAVTDLTNVNTIAYPRQVQSGPLDVVDKSKYVYFIAIENLQNGDDIYGGHVAYTFK